MKNEGKKTYTVEYTLHYIHMHFQCNICTVRWVRCQFIIVAQTMTIIFATNKKRESFILNEKNADYISCNRKIISVSSPTHKLQSHKAPRLITNTKKQAKLNTEYGAKLIGKTS